MPARLLPLVDDAVAVERRWRQVTGRVQPGPLADRLGALGGRVVAGVLELYAVAVRVGELEGVLEALEPDEATAQYKAARRRAVAGEAVPELAAVEARFASTQRLLNLVADAEEQIRLLDARLVAAVARGAELAVTADDRALASTGTDLEAVVDELGALRTALSGLA